MTSRIAPSTPRGQPVIDVDQVYLKYEYNSDEDGIETIDANTFRQSVRRSAGREKEKDKMRRSVAAGLAASRTPQTPRTREDSVTRLGPQAVNTERVTQKHLASSSSNANTGISSQPLAAPAPRVSNSINHPSELGAVIQRVSVCTSSFPMSLSNIDPSISHFFALYYPLSTLLLILFFSSSRNDPSPIHHSLWKPLCCRNGGS